MRAHLAIGLVVLSGWLSTGCGGGKGADPLSLWSVAVPTLGVELSTVLVARDGSVIAVGFTNGNLNGEIRAGVIDAFVTKYSSRGQHVWTRLLGLAGAETEVFHAVISPSDEVYFAGTTTGALGAPNPSGNENAFVAKVSPNGDLTWVKQFAPTSGENTAHGLALSGSTLYVVGSTGGPMDSQTVTGSTDMFLMRLANDGSHQWTRLFGTFSETTFGNRVAVDGSGGVYVVGTTAGGLGGESMGGAIETMFLTRFDTSGNRDWTRLLGPSGNEAEGSDLAISGSTVYVVGATEGALPTGTAVGLHDGFVAQYTTAGARNWVHQYGVAATNSLLDGIMLGSNGMLFVTGATQGALASTPTGSVDAVALRIDPANGNTLWAQQIGYTGATARAKASFLSGDTLVVGGFVQNGGIGSLPPVGTQDGFVALYTAATGAPLF